MDKVSTRQLIDDALQVANQLAQKNPSDSTVPIVIEQLLYLKQVYERDGNLNAIPKGKMTLGVIAAKEYDTTQPDLANLLYKIDWILDHSE